VLRPKYSLNLVDTAYLCMVSSDQSNIYELGCRKVDIVGRARARLD